MTNDRYGDWMRDAIREASRALETGDVPVAALVVDDAGEVIARAVNERERHSDPTGHAELIAIREAARVRADWRLADVTLVVTLEPCVMCAGAIVAARIPRLVFGAWDEKAGAVGSRFDIPRDRRLNHRVEVVAGVEEQACAALLTDFFDERR